jgi:hypothetical protein
MNADSELCWKRLRMMIDWALWLFIILSTGAKDAGFTMLFLIGMACFIRPKTGPRPDAGNKWSGPLAAIIFMVVLLTTIPLMDSPEVDAYLQTGPGFLVKLALWGAFVLSEVSNYRRLPPFRCAIQQHADGLAKAA